MKIVFVDPYLTELECNIGLGYLCSVLRQNGHSVRVVGRYGNFNEIVTEVEKAEADIIGFPIKSSTIEKSVEIAKKIKKPKNSLLICGGPHITVDGMSFLKEYPFFDLGVVGEAEKTILEIIDYLNGRKALEDIKGIIRRKDNELFSTGIREFEMDLDKLPFPDYTAFDIFSKNMKIYYLLTSRGCPYSCIFCNGPSVLGRKWRRRSVDNIIQEVIHVKETYKGLELFDIADDNFTFDKARAKEFCRMLLDKRLDMRWRCSTGIRADKVDEELLGLMRESGCESISFGIESGSPEVFKGIKKGEKLETIEKAVQMAKATGLKVVASFIIGLPNSNYERDMESVRFAKRLKLDQAWFNLYCPFIKTEGHEILSRQNNVKFLHDWKNTPIMFHYSNVYCVFETDDYPEAQRIKAYMKGNLQLFNYSFIKDFAKHSLSISRMITLLKLIIKYDMANATGHLLRLNKKFFISLQYRLKRLSA